MKNSDLYRRYLLADRFMKGAARAGLETNETRIEVAASYYGEGEDYGGYQGYGADIHVEISGVWMMKPEEREAAAVRLLDELPFLLMTRHDGKIQFHAHVGGLKIESDLGVGVCERVQVGTRKVSKPDPELLAKATEAVPLVEVVEPIYETRCIDPISQSLNA